MDIRNALKESIAHSLSGLDISVGAQNVPLEHPAELKNDDNVRPIHTGNFGFSGHTNPRALAEKIVAKLGTIDGIAKIEIAGAGFINFYLAPSVLAAAVETARKEDMWGSNATQKGKTVMMEYTDPNPFKEFH